MDRDPAAALSSAGASPGLVRGLGMWDSVLLLTGGVIGSGIFLTAGEIAGELPHPLWFLLVWVAGAAVSLLACFAFAELGAMYPQAGGQYVYLREAFGDLPAFLWGWMSFAVTGPGTIAALAVGFAAYLGPMVPGLRAARVVATVAGWHLTVGHLTALAAIALLTLVNVVGLRRAAILQNLATLLKFGAIGIFLLLGFTIGHGSWSHFHAPLAGGAAPVPWAAFGVALIAVLWAYDGWVYLSWVAGEVKDPQRTLPRAMVVGVCIIGVLYLALNAVYVYALPVPAMAGTIAIGQAAAVRLFSSAAGVWLAGMIALSCFGALSCGILAYSRIYYAMAEDGLFFRRLVRVHPRFRTPAASLVVQAVWSGVLALTGRFDQLFTYTMFMMVVSYAATVVGLFVLRRTRSEIARPYRCTGYPWLPAVYVVFALAWSVNAVVEMPKETLAGALILLLGVPGYYFWRRRGPRAGESVIASSP